MRTRQRAGHAHLEIVGAEPGGAQRLEAFLLDGRDVAVTAFEAAACAIERAIDSGRLGPLLGTEVAIARAEREAVVRAHRRRTDDLHRQAEVFHRAANDRELLVILLAEDADVGLHQVQELHDHGRDTLEVPGAERAAQDAGEIGHVDDRAAGGPERIHLLDGGQEQHVHALALEQRRVVVRGARVGLVVLVRAELQRVHEHARHHAAAVQVRGADEARVPRVQVAHGRHEGDAFARHAPTVHDGAQLCDARDDLHVHGRC